MTFKAAQVNTPQTPGSRRWFSMDTRCSRAAMEAAGADELHFCLGLPLEEQTANGNKMRRFLGQAKSQGDGVA